MPFLIPVAVAVSTFLITTAVVVITAIGSALVWIASALAVALGPVWAAIVGTITGVIEALGMISGATAGSIMSALGTLNATTVSIFLNVSAFIDAIAIGFGAFLEVIHFRTLIQVHEIAYLVSEDYREVMAGVYYNIGEYGRAIGFGPTFLMAAIRNARLIVLDTSAMLGRSYDLAEITWLTELDSFLAKVAEQSEDIARRPYDILWKIDAWLIRPSVDMKAGIMAGMFNTVEGVIDATQTTVNNVNTVIQDLEQFYNDLPPFIKDEISDYMRPFFKTYWEFMWQTYTPAMTEINKVMDILVPQIAAQHNQFDDLLERLKRPGDFLLEIDRLEGRDKQRQERIIGEIANRTAVREGLDVSTDVYDEMERLKRISDALERDRHPPSWFVEEQDRPQRSATEKAKPRNTWFVGDY